MLLPLCGPGLLLLCKCSCAFASLLLLPSGAWCCHPGPVGLLRRPGWGRAEAGPPGLGRAVLVWSALVWVGWAGPGCSEGWLRPDLLGGENELLFGLFLVPVML